MLKNRKIEQILNSSVLPFVTKPGRYIGNEINVIRKDLSQVDIRFALAFPEVYEIAMSSLTTNLLYHLLNQIEFVWAERVFAPWPDMEDRMRAQQLPLYTLESFSPVHGFDVIGFTLQYELTYTNIINMLNLANIPIWANQRDAEYPLIIAGGPCSANPEPVADFIDAFFIGDAEGYISEICHTLQQAKEEGLARAATLNRLAQIRGVYVPSLYHMLAENGRIVPRHESAYRRIHTAIVAELKCENYPEKPLVPLIEVTHDRVAVEIMRGCTEGCRYCNAGMIYRPTRERPVADIVHYTQNTLANTGYDEVSFLSLSTSDYTDLSALMLEERMALAGDKVNFSFPSLRLDSFNSEIAEFASSVRKSGFTFAPEAGSARLRRVINKNISDNDLITAVKIALQNGWKTLKFYFMIGLPTETKEDVKAIARLMERIVQLARKYGKIKLNVSISPFSPKAHTPFQWERQCTKEEFWEKIDLLKVHFNSMKQVKLNWRNPALSEIECILGRGDRRLAQVIYTAWEKGAKFDGWDEMFQYHKWVEAFQEQGIDMNTYLQEIPEESALPWEHIDKGIMPNFLRRERKNAYEESIIIDCKQGTCHACGIQRKNGFREFAACYKQLDLHTHNGGNNVAEKQLKSVQHIGLKQPPAELTDKTLLRIHFEKMGFSKYLSHLDMMRAFERGFRRAAIKLVYSQGFNPRSKMSFGPALPLGYTSSAEFVDIEILSTVSPDFKEILNSVLPEGIKILQIKTIPLSTPSLNASINMAEYQIKIRDHKTVHKSISDFLKRNDINITRITKGRRIYINIRPYVESIARDNGSLFILTKRIESRTVRISEILSQLYDSSEQNIREIPVHRTQQYIKSKNNQKSPMDVY